MRAFLKNYRQSPRKVRLVTDSVKGKSVDQAVSALSFLPKRAGKPIAKLILSAKSNAPTRNDTSILYIKSIRVDGGNTLKRSTPGARGRAFPIRKRTSHVTIELGVREKHQAPSTKSEKKTQKANE